MDKHPEKILEVFLLRHNLVLCLRSKYNNTVNVEYRLLHLGEEDSVCRFIADCFNKFIAPEYTEAGVKEFFKYANPRSLKDRLQKDHFVLIQTH